MSEKPLEQTSITDLKVQDFLDHRMHQVTTPLPDKTYLHDYQSYVSWLKENEFTHHFFETFRLQNVFQFWNKEYISALAKSILGLINNGSVLEVCAGDGCLAHWLKEYGVNMVSAVDNFSWPNMVQAFSVEKLDAIEAIRRYKPRMVIASWIEYGSKLDIDILKEDIEYIVVIGEKQGGCTGSDEFWEWTKFKYEALQKLGECDRWNLCRSDSYLYGFDDRDVFPRHSTTTFLHKKATRFRINGDRKK